MKWEFIYCFGKWIFGNSWVVFMDKGIMDKGIEDDICPDCELLAEFHMNFLKFCFSKKISPDRALELLAGEIFMVMEDASYNDAQISLVLVNLWSKFLTRNSGMEKSPKKVDLCNVPFGQFGDTYEK
jgi:hypothetical protein